MPFIYKIINDINEKVYIGKTLESIEKRFKEHVNDCQKHRCENRPQYAAMRKYGVEHFSAIEVEECDEADVNIREVYWIEQCDSYNSGYNATKGGDGKSYIDYDKVVEAYQKSRKISFVCQSLNVDPSTVKKILRLRGVDTSDYQHSEFLRKSVIMKDKENVLIRSFVSVRVAARYLIQNGLSKSGEGGLSGKISACCRNKGRKSVCGYKWEYC